MKRTAIGFIAILLLITILGGCLGGESTAPPAPPSTLPAIQSEIATLKAQVATLTAQIATLITQASTATTVVDVTPLEVSIATLDAQILALTERIALYESDSGIVVDEGGNITVPTTWGVIRWRTDVSMAYKTITDNSGNATAEHIAEIKEDISFRIEDINPRTIKEEDLYDMSLVVDNKNSEWDITLTDVVFTVMLRPDDYVPIQFPGYAQMGGNYYADQDYFQTGGAYNEGDELDLSEEEIAELEAQGYIIER